MGRFPCRFDILLEKDENGDVFGDGWDQALFCLSQYSYQARSNFRFTRTAEENENNKNSIVPLITV